MTSQEVKRRMAGWYRQWSLGANATIAGPAIIEETTTTLLLLERQTATTDSYGNYLVEVE
jgi:hypothetical protein